MGTAGDRTERPDLVDTDAKFGSWLEIANRQDEANSLAQNLCRAGGGRLRGTAQIYESSTPGEAAIQPYHSQSRPAAGPYQYDFGYQIFFSATCSKRVRR